MSRRLLVSATMTLAVATVPMSRSVAGAGSTALDWIRHIVVIYQENHSFDNLYGTWEGVNGLGRAGASAIQVAQDGSQYSCLLQNDPNLTSPSPLTPVCSDAANGVAFVGHFENGPFTIDPFIPPTAATCPNGVPGGEPGGCTRDRYTGSTRSPISSTEAGKIDMSPAATRSVSRWVSTTPGRFRSTDTCIRTGTRTTRLPNGSTRQHLGARSSTINGSSRPQPPPG